MYKCFGHNMKKLFIFYLYFVMWSDSLSVLALIFSLSEKMCQYHPCKRVFLSPSSHPPASVYNTVWLRAAHLQTISSLIWWGVMVSSHSFTGRFRHTCTHTVRGQRARGRNRFSAGVCLAVLSAVWFSKHRTSFEIDHLRPEHRFSNVISQGTFAKLFSSKPRPTLCVLCMQLKQY